MQLRTHRVSRLLQELWHSILKYCQDAPKQYYNQILILDFQHSSSSFLVTLPLRPICSNRHSGHTSRLEKNQLLIKKYFASGSTMVVCGKLCMSSNGCSAGMRLSARSLETYTLESSTTKLACDCVPALCPAMEKTGILQLVREMCNGHRASTCLPDVHYVRYQHFNTAYYGISTCNQDHRDQQRFPSFWRHLQLVHLHDACFQRHEQSSEYHVSLTLPQSVHRVDSESNPDADQTEKCSLQARISVPI